MCAFFALGLKILDMHRGGLRPKKLTDLQLNWQMVALKAQKSRGAEDMLPLKFFALLCLKSLKIHPFWGL